MTEINSILDRRRAGVLLHITSLPSLLGEGDNGDLGPAAFRFVDFLARTGATVWQTLPINPTHVDGSPYQALSVHAGNTCLISPESLIQDDWIDGPLSDQLSADETPGQLRRRCLREAYARFKRLKPGSRERSEFDCFAESHAWWLSDYALYMAIREESGNDAWTEWPTSLRERWPAAIQAARRRLADTVTRIEFEQYLFHSQWTALREYAAQRQIVLFGDMPIFVAGDSADVWACREYFDLDDDGHPRVVAGVPPDYFSATGQRWGNPHYRWSAMEADGFRWWIGRLRSQLELYDWVRIDHFRGFEAYWEIPADSPTAIDGRWVKAPGAELLTALMHEFSREALPLVAEDLGIITAEVDALRDQFALPGMKILQFAFDSGPTNPYLPRNHPANCVVYTGTHDNDTTLSWFEQLSAAERDVVYEHLGQRDLAMPWALIRAALASPALLAMLPMQDILGLGQGHRMNTPGTVEDNWRWAFRWEQVSDELTDRIASWIREYGRAPEQPELREAPIPARVGTEPRNEVCPIPACGSPTLVPAR